METDKSVTEICTMVGFHSNNTFYKAFKRVYGIAPGKWKTGKESNKADNFPCESYCKEKYQEKISNIQNTGRTLSLRAWTQFQILNGGEKLRYEGRNGQPLMIAAQRSCARNITGCGAKQTDQTGSRYQRQRKLFQQKDNKDMFNESGRLPILKEKKVP